MAARTTATTCWPSTKTRVRTGPIPRTEMEGPTKVRPSQAGCSPGGPWERPDDTGAACLHARTLSHEAPHQRVARNGGLAGEGGLGKDAAGAGAGGVDQEVRDRL